MQALQRASSSTSSHLPARNSRLGHRAVSIHSRPSPFSAPRQHYSIQQFQTPSRGVACQGLFGLGLPEIAVIAGIAALVFGPSKLPELGKGLGKTVKSFQTAAKEFETELKQAAASDDAKPAAAPTNSTEQVKKEVNEVKKD